MSGEYAQAYHHASLALETAEEIGGQRDQGMAARVLGEVEMALSASDVPGGASFQAAQDRLRRSVELLESVGDRFELGKSLRSLGRCLKIAGLEAEGASYLARAVQTFQDLGAQGELSKSVSWEAEKLGN